MRATIFAATIIIGFALNADSGQAAGPIQPLRVGNWSGGSYTNDKTGAFSHCVANAPYNSGISFFVSVNSSFQWSIGFASPAWQLVSGETIPVDLTFDGRSQYHVFATAVTSQLVGILMPSNSALIRTFREARQMQAVARGQVFGFDLNQTSILLPALVDCVRRNVGLPVIAKPAAPITKTAPVVGARSTSVPVEAPAAAASANTEAMREVLENAKQAAALLKDRMYDCTTKQLFELSKSGERAAVISDAAMTLCSNDIDAAVKAAFDSYHQEYPSAPDAYFPTFQQSAKEAVSKSVNASAVQVKAALAGEKPNGATAPVSTSPGSAPPVGVASVGRTTSECLKFTRQVFQGKVYEQDKLIGAMLDLCRPEIESAARAAFLQDPSSTLEAEREKAAAAAINEAKQIVAVP